MRGGDGLKPEVGAEDAGQKVLLNAEETAETKKQRIQTGERL